MSSSNNWRNSTDLTTDPDNRAPAAPAIVPSRGQKTPVPLPANVQHLYQSPSSDSRPTKTPTPTAVARILPKIGASQAKKTPVPLPENVRHLASGSASSRASPAISPYSSASSATSSRPSNFLAKGGQNNSTQPSYVPVYADARNRSNAFGFENKAEKRRKVANNDVGIGVRRHGVQMQQVSRSAGTPNTGAEQKLIYANGVPTVQSLNCALKTNGTRMTVSSTMLASEGRELSIGQMPEVRSSTAPNAHSSAPNHFNHASMVPRKTIREMELGSSDLEESGWHDADMVSWSFRKSPVKKKKKKKREGSVTHGMPEAPPLAIGGMREPTISIPLPAVDDDGDSVISNPSRSNDYQPMLVDDLDKSAVPSKPTNSAVRPQDSRSGFYTLQEDHLIIYLKEAKNTSWRDIANFFPSRTRYTVQSRYSKILNKRDRSLDPPTWDLPSWYTAKTLRAASTDRNSITHAGLATMEIEEHKEPSTSMLQTTQQRGRPREIDQQPPYELSSKADSAPRKLPGRPPRLPQDPSSGNESAPQRAASRPRRSAPAVDYTWPRRRRNPQGQDESEDDGVNLDFDPRRIPLPLDSTAVSEEPPETSLAIIPVDEPMVMNFDHQDALLLTSGQKLPYLSSSERASVRQGVSNSYWDQLVGREWQGAFIHSDFSHDELATVERAANALLSQPRNIRPRSLRKGLQRLLRDQPESKLLQLSHEVRRSLKTRDRESIDAFLTDARSGQLRKYPHVERLGAVRPDRKYSSHPKMSISTHVRQRELGLQSRRGWKAPSKTLTYELRNKVLDTLGPAISYTGASSDVHTVAWSPDGQCFAAGAVCVTDDASMQYNRPNNLLYGDVTMKVIHELAEHRIARPKTDSGPNSSHAMYVSQDPFLYTTVAAVAFSPDGEHMYSVGYDSYATIWGATYDGSQPELLKALRHRAEVDLLTVSPTGAVATASKRWRNSVKLMPITGTISDKDSFHSRKADERPDHNILPTALKFEPRYGRLLLAGFGANRREDQHDISGDICLWDVETRHELLVHGSTKNVFDVAFNPIQREQPLFAVGCVAGSGVNKGTRSTVRFYDYRGFEKYGMIMETESPALDMNDVLYCPYDENLVAAGCTSGQTYIWDVRRPDSFLYRLSHGKSLMPLDDHLPTEMTDTGVRFLSWGDNATRLYTGSSDGVVKVWDTARAQEDVFIKDLITTDSGIMSGSFSPDYSKLIIGEVNGSINILEVGKEDEKLKDIEKFKYIPYMEEDEDMTTQDNDAILGQVIAAELLATQQMITVPFGGYPVRQAVQGVNYSGPFDNSVDAPYLREQALQFQLNLATPSGGCEIHACKDNVVKITGEETGDSGRSKDRIPDELRQQWTMRSSNNKIFAGKSKCDRCGRPALLTETTAAVGEALFCERCSFACFRCGERNTVPPETETLHCGHCGRTWDIGALGYELISDTLRTAQGTDYSNVPWLRGYKKDIYLSKITKKDNATFGDEMNALTDHYHSLAICSPDPTLL